jgi:DNA repair exonuclease SbcCD nuclease subunit
VLDVVLAHGSTPGAPHWEAGSALRIEWEALEGLGADYLALGDLHRFRGPAELRGAPACYPGSFAAVDLTEWGQRGPVLVDLAPDAPPGIRRLSSGVREVGERIVVDVTACASDDDVAERVAERAGSAYPVATLEGEPGFPLDLERVAAALEERFGAAALEDRSRFFDAARLEEIARRNTIAGHVARLGLDTLSGATDETREEIEQGLRIALRVMEIS